MWTWLLCLFKVIVSWYEPLLKVLGNIYREVFFYVWQKPRRRLKGFTLLGNQGTKYSFEYAPEVLESVDNLHSNRDYFVKFNCPEFTSLCPITATA